MNYATAPWKSCTEQYGDTDPDWSLTRRSVLQKTPSKPEIRPSADTLSQHINGLCSSDHDLREINVHNNGKNFNKLNVVRNPG